MPAPLVTSAQIAAALHAATAEDLLDLPAKVTAIAESYCGRPLALATFDDEYLPSDEGTVRLKTWPVVDEAGVFATPSVVLWIAPVAAPGIWGSSVKLIYDGPDPTIPTGIALASIVGGLSTPVLIRFLRTGGSLLATVGALAGAVNATGNWTAAIPGDFGNCPTSELRGSQGQSTTLAGPVGLIAWTSLVGDYDLRPDIGKISIARFAGCGSWGSSSGFGGYTSGFGGGVISRSRVVRVRYTAGYNGDPTAGPVTVPANLAEACLQMAKAILDCRQVSGVIKSVSLGNSSFTAADGAAALTPGVIALLSRFVDRRM